MFPTGLASFSIVLPLPLSIIIFFFTVFNPILSNSNRDKVFSFNLSGKAFIFQDFNAHHKDWLNFYEELIGLVKFEILNQFQATLLRCLLLLLGSETGISAVVFCSSSTFIYTWFLADCVAAIAHGNNWFHLYQQDKGKGKRGSSYRLAIFAKCFLKLSNLSMLILFSTNLIIQFWTKVNLMYLFHLVVLRCFLLHQIKQSFCWNLF